MELGQLLQMLGQMGAKPKQGVSAPNAMQTIQARKQYNDYVIEAQSMGQQPIPFEQWVQGQR
ncbi:MAG: hypothetical protein HQK87_06945 [Nitrospinae bacterium]|nr:hypothetical protein [Nitrospinota bacterium]